MELLKNITYVVIPELPDEEQAAFKKWLVGQTMPLVESEGENAFWCAYKWDYDRFQSHFNQGKIAPVWD